MTDRHLLPGPQGNACPHYADMLTRWRELGELGRAIIPHKIAVSPDPEEFEAMIEDLEALWAKVDPLIRSIGEYVAANSSRNFDLSVATDQLRGALEGNLTYEIQCEADQLRDDIAEAAA